LWLKKTLRIIKLPNLLDLQVMTELLLRTKGFRDRSMARHPTPTRTSSLLRSCLQVVTELLLRIKGFQDRAMARDPIRVGRIEF